MLWSQIKLTSYDFSDLDTTGEFDNRPDTRRFFKNFLLRGHIAFGRWPASVYENICRCPAGLRTMSGWCPAGVVRDQPENVRRSADFTRIFTCNNIYIYIKQEMSLKKTNGVRLKKEENITQG